jgi:hypothetical protein
MLRALLILVLAVALLAIAFVALAPASLLAGRVEKATGGTFAAREVEGTIWRGRGVLAAGAAQLPFAWTVEPTSLLHGEMRADVAPFDGSSAASPRGHIVAARNQVSLRTAEVTLPAALPIQSTAFAKIGLVADGDVTLTTSRLDWTPTSIDGDARAVWRRARLTLPPFPPVDLGELTATLGGSGTRLAGPLVNQGGDVDIRGTVSVGLDRSADVSLTLTPRKADDALTRLLAAFGTPDGAGWRITWRVPPKK